MDFWAVVREFGLPLAMLAFFIGAIASGLYVAGRELKDREKAWATRDAEREKEADEAFAYVEARRMEEREGRLAAEAQLAALAASTTESIRAMTGLLGNIEKEVIRGGLRSPPDR